jgi:3-isopropylmalate dehydrogenase
MMLEWLGIRHDIAPLTTDGQRLRQAVEQVMEAGTVVTADLGGQASTQETGQAVMAALA